MIIENGFITERNNKKYLRASGSIPVDGSSSNIIGGLHINAIATDNFLLFPPDKFPLLI